MAAETPPPQSPTPPPTEGVDAIVGEFMAEKEKQTAELERLSQKRSKRPLVTAALAVLCAAAWIAPSFLPQERVPISLERMEAGARMSLFLAAERVRTFERKNGRLPEHLAAAGVDSSNIAYTPGAKADFELSTRVGDSLSIRYQSTMSAAEFLGATITVLTSER